MTEHMKSTGQFSTGVSTSAACSTAVRATRGLLLAVFAVGLLSGCGAMIAQNPSGNYTPVNAAADGDDKRVLVQGADLVSYFVDGKHQRGDAKFSSTYEDITFRFANAEHKAMFDREPAKYLPQFGGYCASGISYGIPWGGNADVWSMVDGKLYFFGGQSSKDAFELDAKASYALAHKYWDEEVKGNNSWLQRMKRLVFRVPHYKSDAELAAAVAAKKAAAGQSSGNAAPAQ